MIKEALEYIVGLKAPVIQEIDGSKYSDKELERISFNPKARTIYMSTLSSLVEYIKSDVDAMMGDMIIHVESPTCVKLYSMLDDERTREYLVQVDAKVPEFTFGRNIEHESFCIAMQSKFVDDETTNKELILKFAGTVEDGTIAQYGDDGVTQKATVKTGISSKSDAIVPNPVYLRPFRTFIEVEQPASNFIFRMDNKCGVTCALYEADGGAWEMEAMQNIKAYLEDALYGMEHFIVIC